MMAGSTPNTLYLIDAHALIFQVFHAIPSMNTPDGRPTNAVFGFARDLMYIYNDIQPEFLVCAFDLPEPTFRSTIASDYKAHRPPPPDDLQTQIPMIRAVMEGMNIPVIAVPGFEADDVMATLAVAGEAHGLDVLLCTSDKDCRQLVTERVKMLNLRKRIILDRKAIIEDWGVSPEQVIDFQTLVGDKVDNVPGVTGVGEKTAAKLLQQFGTVENLLLHLDEVPGKKVQENLKKSAANGDIAKTRELVKLRTDVPIPLEWDAWRRRDWNGPRLLELFTDFNFRSFADKVRGTQKTTVIVESSKGDLFTETVAPGVDPADVEFAFGALAPADEWNGRYSLIDTPELFETFVERLRGWKRFAFDLETTGLDPLRCKIVGFAFCAEAHEAFYLPIRAPLGEKHLDERKVLDELRPIFENPSIEKVNQNVKFEQLLLRNHAIELRGVVGDSMIAHYLLHSGERSHGLDEITRLTLHHENISITELIGKGKKQKTMDQVPTQQVAEYAGEDADAAWRLCEILEPELAQSGLKKLYDDLEIPLIDVLAEIEGNGIRLDVPFLKHLSVEMAQQLQEVETEIHAIAGKEFNVGSPAQLRQILFNEQKLPVQGRTKLTNEPSTDEEALRKLAALGHALPVKIIEHRQIAKLKGTYVDALPELIHPLTGRIHTSFNQTVAATGRLSSSDPNLQNIPTRTDMGRQIRQAFLPREGWKLLAADYSQIELRMLAHFCNDTALQQAFIDDRDIHASVAADIYKVPEKDVTSDQRRVAKTVNFGVLYGMSPFGLAERLGISRGDAERFIDEYFARYPKVLAYQDKLLSLCRKNGYVSTILGRRRRFDPRMIRSNSKYQQRSQAEREAINMEIQGSAADLIKLAMLAVHRRLRGEKRLARMLLTVHDELVFEVPPTEIAPVTKLVREEMTNAMNLSVPLKVDIAIGSNWLDVDEVAEAA